LDHSVYAVELTCKMVSTQSASVMSNIKKIVLSTFVPSRYVRAVIYETDDDTIIIMIMAENYSYKAFAK